MADPFTATIGAVGIGASLLGSATQASGAMQQAQAQSQMYQYQAGIADYNKTVSLQNADYSRWAGEQQAQIAGLKTGEEIAQTKVAQGAHNLDVNFGSNAEVRTSEHEVGWENQQVIRSNAAIRAYGFETQAVTAGMQGDMYRSASANAAAAGPIAASASILGGISSVSSKWIQGSSLGIFSGGTGGGNFSSGNLGGTGGLLAASGSAGAIY